MRGIGRGTQRGQSRSVERRRGSRPGSATNHREDKMTNQYDLLPYAKGIDRSLAPIVARVEGSGVDRRRGIFTPQGYLVAPVHALAVGMTVTATWTVADNDKTRTAAIAHLGGCGHAVDLQQGDGR